MVNDLLKEFFSGFRSGIFHCVRKTKEWPHDPDGAYVRINCFIQMVVVQDLDCFSYCCYVVVVVVVCVLVLLYSSVCVLLSVPGHGV